MVRVWFLKFVIVHISTHLHKPRLQFRVKVRVKGVRVKG